MVYTFSENKLLTTREVATLLGISEATMRFWRHKDRGPAFVRVGGAVRYRPQEVERWLVSRSVGREMSEPMKSLLEECERWARNLEKKAADHSYTGLLKTFAGQMNLAFGKYCEATMPEVVKQVEGEDKERCRV